MVLSWVFNNQNQDGRRPRVCATSTLFAHLSSIFLYFSLLGSAFSWRKAGICLKRVSVAGGQQSVGESAPAPGQLFLGSVPEPLPLSELQFLP